MTAYFMGAIPWNSSRKGAKNPVVVASLRHCVSSSPISVKIGMSPIGGIRMPSRKFVLVATLIGVGVLTLRAVGADESAAERGRRFLTERIYIPAPWAR